MSSAYFSLSWYKPNYLAEETLKSKVNFSHWKETLPFLFTVNVNCSVTSATILGVTVTLRASSESL